MQLYLMTHCEMQGNRVSQPKDRVGILRKQKKRHLKPVAEVPFLLTRFRANFLDEVDVSREVGGDFHANGLFANLRLVPDFHDDLLDGGGVELVWSTAAVCRGPMCRT
jgi:hypothetical protein